MKVSDNLKKNMIVLFGHTDTDKVNPYHILKVGKKYVTVIPLFKGYLHKIEKEFFASCILHDGKGNPVLHKWEDNDKFKNGLENSNKTVELTGELSYKTDLNDERRGILTKSYTESCEDFHLDFTIMMEDDSDNPKLYMPYMVFRDKEVGGEEWEWDNDEFMKAVIKDPNHIMEFEDYKEVEVKHKLFIQNFLKEVQKLGWL